MAQIKTKNEIGKIKKACQITDMIFKKIIGQDLTIFTEIELRDFILAEIKKRGLKPSFPPIVTSGPRAGNEIHPKSTDAKLEGFVIIDFGVIYEKYMSDMTRTVFVTHRGKTKPTKFEINIYVKVLKSQMDSLVLFRDGFKCALADQKARDVLGDDATYFIHTLGHGVGTRIHESPKIYYKITRPTFKTGMVATDEPGVYIPNTLGIRIEDTVVVGNKKPIILTRSTKELLVF